MNKFFIALTDFFMLFTFHRTRVEFYNDWKKSIQADEILVDFLRAEYEISVNKQTANFSRAYALKAMIKRLTIGNETSPSRIVGLSMPAGDRVLLSAADEYGQKALLIVLDQLSGSIIAQKEASDVIKAALYTPIILLPGLGILCYVLSAKIIPIVEGMAPPEVWTTFNSSIRMLSNFIRFNWAYVFIISALSISLFVYALPRWHGESRLRLERMRPSVTVWLSPFFPMSFLLPLSIYRDFQAITVLSSLAVLLKMGLTLKDALTIIARTARPYLRYHINRILFYIDEMPLEVSSAFTSGLLSPQVAARFATTARTSKKYEDVLIEAGTSGSVYIRTEVKNSARKLNLIFLTITVVLTLFLYIGQQNIYFTMQSEMSPSKMESRRLEGVKTVK